MDDAQGFFLKHEWINELNQLKVTRSKWHDLWCRWAL